jgi:hypothetical protein
LLRMRSSSVAQRGIVRLSPHQHRHHHRLSLSIDIHRHDPGAQLDPLARLSHCRGLHALVVRTYDRCTAVANGHGQACRHRGISSAVAKFIHRPSLDTFRHQRPTNLLHPWDPVVKPSQPLLRAKSGFILEGLNRQRWQNIDCLLSNVQVRE